MNAIDICRRLAELIGEDGSSPLDALPSTAVGHEDEAVLELDGGDGTKFLLTVTRKGF